MKKIFTLLLVMMGFFAQSMYAEPLKNPDPAKTYMIQHSSGLFLTVDGNSAKIMNAGSGTSQKFTFEIVADAENTYNIKLEDGRYLGSDGSYTVKFLEDPADDFTRFTFWECTEVDHVKMWNLGRKAYFGTDQNSDGAGVFSDKNGNDGKHAWRFIEASDGLIYSALETAIANAKNNVAEKPVSESFSQEGIDAYNAAIATAEAALGSATEQSEVNDAATTLSAFTNAVNNLFNAISNANETLASANIGDTTGSYPQASADALSAAIAEAMATWTSADPEAYNAAVPVLNSALSSFGNTRYVFVPEAGKKYYFVNTYNNLMLGVNSNGEAVLANPTAEDTQKFEIIPVEGLSVAFNLKIADGSGYLAYKGGWNSTTLADPAQEAAQIFFDIVDLEKKVYTLNRFNFNGAWASDKNNPGSLIYTNKSRNQLNAKWQILEVVDGEFLTIGLEKAIENAENYISKAVVGEEPGNYPQSAVDALSAALNTAKNAVPASQQDVNDITDTLNAAINAFLAEKINSVIKDELEAAIAAAYAKAAAAQIGIEVGQYYESAIEAFEAQIAIFEDSAKNVTDQEACDALTEEIIAATEAFAGNTEIQPVADVLNDAIECAEALYEAEKDNIGTDQGQRPQEAVDAFAAAIATAKGVSAPELTDLEALLDARYAFINGAISVNRTPLRKAINEAEAEEFSDLKAGDFNGYYPQENIDAFNAALAAAKEAEADMEKTQEEIDACTKALNDAMAALRKSVISVKFTDLDSAIAKAEAAIAGATVVGPGEGQCPQAVVDALNSVLTEAKAIDRAAINQASVDTQVEALNSAIATFTEELIASTGLEQAIANAQDILDNATQGFKPGNYPVSAINGLTEAIAAANATAENAGSTQADLIAALDTLKAAVETFKAQAVPAHDLSGINAAIAEAEDFIAESGVQDFGLEMALADAKNIVADADNHTKSEIEKARTALIKALEYARENAGIDSIASGKLNAYTNANGIVVEGISGKTIVAVYTLDGRTVTIAETYGPSCSIDLSAGKYVVAIRTANATESNIMIVK